jgi:hypothetical protein
MDKIDTNIWVTQQQLAKELGFSIQRIHNWVQRKRIETLYINELNITLVNRLTIKVKEGNY